MGMNEMTKEQRMARVGMLFDLKEPLTPEENAALDRPYAEWPETLKAKAGALGELCRIEDERAASQSPGR